MRFFSILVLFLFSSFSVFSQMYHHSITPEEISTKTFYWEADEISPFDELLISWNAFRPKLGHYAIYVSVKTDLWSPWLLYAQWGHDFQKSFISPEEGTFARVYQDAVEILKGKLATGFKIHVVGENIANLSQFNALHVCASNLSSVGYSKMPPTSTSYLLEVKGLSQMDLKDPRKDSLCSPTSTTAVIRFIKNDTTLDPIQFAENSWDSSFDIFGNWVFNVAQAYHEINLPSYLCWVERCENFQKILASLEKGFPCVISIRGPLTGSALPYKSGHLIVVMGYDAEKKEVICMDPAFPKDGETRVRYQLEDLQKAWERRKNVAYIFEQSSSE